jgi:hypothetical protein
MPYPEFHPGKQGHRHQNQPEPAQFLWSAIAGDAVLAKEKGGGHWGVRVVGCEGEDEHGRVPFTLLSSSTRMGFQYTVLNLLHAVNGAVLDGFGDVLGLEVGGVVEVGDGAGDFEDAIGGAGGESEFADGALD